MAKDSTTTASPTPTAATMDNPFMLAMSQARKASENFTKMFGEVKMPATPDVTALMSSYRRNIEAMTAANRVAIEGAQAVAKRHMEIMQQSMAEMAEALRSLTAVENPKAKAAKNTALLKTAYEHAVANAKELSDLIQHANAEAVSVLNKRFAEAMDEMKTALEKTKA